MNLPDLDPSGGPLRMADVLVEYEGPQVFVAQNAGRATFLAMHALPDESADRWLYVRISQARRRRIAAGVESLRRAFEDPEYHSPAVARYLADGIEINFSPKTQELAELYPDPDSFLESEDYVESARELIVPEVAKSKIPHLVERAQAPLWETNNEIIEFFRANKTPAYIAARLTSRPVLDVTFSAGKDRIDYPIKDLGSVLTSTQSLFDVLSSGDTMPERGPVPKALTEQTRLLAIASFPSSFGLRIEAERGDLIGDDRIQAAIEIFIRILKTVGAESAFHRELRLLPRRAQRHVKSFVSSVRKGNSDFAVEAGLPYEDHSRKIHLSQDDVVWLDTQLNRVVDDIERVFEIDARLTGVSLKTRFFMLTDEGGAEYSGKISDNALTKINEKRINHLHRAKIEETVIINESTGEENYKFRLIDIDEIE